MLGRPVVGRWAFEPGVFGGRPLRLVRLRFERGVRHEASMIEWVEISDCGPSQRVAEAGGSLALEAQGVGGSSPDNDGAGRYCQTARVRQARREGVVRANQWLNPLKRGIGSNLADVGRDAVRAVPGGPATPWLVFRGWRGGHGEGLRRTHGEAAGAKLDAAPVDRSAMNVGTALGLPAGWRAGSLSAVGPWVGRSLRSSPRSGKPAAWRREAADLQRPSGRRGGRR
jgi:hypothetical protein